MASSSLKPATTSSAVVGRVIAELRDLRNLKQGELANAVGVTQSTWSKIENGRSSITVDQLLRAATALQFRAHDVLAMTEDSIQNLQRNGIAVEQTEPAKGIGDGFVKIETDALTSFLMLTPSRDRA